MKKFLFLTLSILSITNSFSQIYSEDWDSPVIGWITDNVDGDPFQWTQIPASILVGSPIESFSNSMTSGSVDPNSGTPLSPNEYLASPAINLNGLSGRTFVMFDYAIAKPTGVEFDSISLYISTTPPAVGSIQNNVSNGTYTEMLDTLITTGNVILSKKIELTSFHGQVVYLIFRHHIANGNSAIFVDNIQVINSNFTINSTIGCIGSTFTVSNTSVGNGNLNVTWNFSDADASISTSSSNIENVSYGSVGQKTITQYINGVPMMTKFVDVQTIPDPSFTASVTSGCSPLQVTFTSTDNFGMVYNFSNGDTIPLNSGYTLTKTFQAGVYTATLTQTIDSQCIGTSTVPITITVYQSPTASFEPTENNLDMLYPTASFINNSTGAISYEWDFGDTSIHETELSPSHLYPTNTEGSYDVKLIAISSDGCRDSMIVTIIVEESILFYVPNAFTPNGDEYNNTFAPKMITGFDPTAYNLKIYNRWGELVFESNDPDIGWDGDYGAGNTVTETQMYTYKLRFTSSKNDEVRTAVGSVLLMK